MKVFLGRSADGKKRYLERTVRGTRREADQELAVLLAREAYDTKPTAKAAWCAIEPGTQATAAAWCAIEPTSAAPAVEHRLAA